MKNLSANFRDHNDLLGIVKGFMEKSGWTIERFGLMEPTTRTTEEYETVDYVKIYKTITEVDRRMGMQLVASKAGAIFSFRSIDGYLFDRETYLKHSLLGQRGVVVQVLGGFDPELKFISQVRRTSQKCLLESSTGGTVYLFSQGDYLLITTKYGFNKYSSIAFGTMPVHVAGTDGRFITSTHALDSGYNAPLFSDYAPMCSYRYKYGAMDGWDAGVITRSEMMVYGYANLEFPTNDFPSSGYGGVGNFARCGRLAGGFPGLVPVQVYVLLGDKYSPFAQFSDVFFTSFEHVEPGQVFEIGQNKYVGFPFLSKTDQINASKNLGYVVRLDD